MVYYGRAGLWDDFIIFQAKARKARLEAKNAHIQKIKQANAHSRTFGFVWSSCGRPVRLLYYYLCDCEVVMLDKLIGPVTGLLDKFIEDKDQKNALAHEIATMSQKYAQEIAQGQMAINRGRGGPQVAVRVRLAARHRMVLRFCFSWELHGHTVYQFCFGYIGGRYSGASYSSGHYDARSFRDAGAWRA